MFARTSRGVCPDVGVSAFSARTGHERYAGASKTSKVAVPTSPAAAMRLPRPAEHLTPAASAVSPVGRVLAEGM